MAYAYLALIVILLVCFYLWRQSKVRAPELTAKDVAQEMQSRASQAVETAANEHGVDLDYSSDSVAKVEEILGTIHQQHRSFPFSQDQLVNESLKWGAYLGEVIRKLKPCHWELDSEVGGEGSLPIVYEDERRESFPIGWCYKRIKNGPEDNVWHKFTLLVLEDRSLPGSDISQDRGGQ